MRRTTGQLIWASSQTRPDLSFDSYLLSTKLNKATFRDAVDSLKATQKAKNTSVKLKFSHLGNINDLHIELYPDASLGNIEENLQTKSMMGYFACLANSCSKISPLNWKSKVIDKVAPDIKTAETLALEQALDDCIHLGNMLSEIYCGDPEKHRIPIKIFEDSKSLVESIYSTKKVQRKTMRVVISKIQEHLLSGRVIDVQHVCSKDQLGDVFTKKGASPDNLLRVLENGYIEHRGENKVC